MSRANRKKLLEYRHKKTEEILNGGNRLSDLRPKKTLGQNFLIDANIRRKIIETAELKREETVLEIGAGLGVLTEAIAPLVKRVIAVETDGRFCRELRKKFADKNVDVIEKDFLKLDLTILPAPLKIIGNLPYYITSPILERILAHQQSFDTIFITVQLEFGERMVACPHTKEYSALSCFVQYYTKPKMIFKIRKTSFKPVPKVDSCFLKLVPREHKPKAVNEHLLFKIIPQAFQQRRKTILNTLRGVVTKEVLLKTFEKLQIQPHLRAENLTVTDFVNLTNELQEAL